MPTTLLTTKLFKPAVRPDAVARPHLIERLDEGARSGRRLTLLSAPAGYGKTTLVSMWLQGAAWPSAWLSLDVGDNDPVRFFVHLVAALTQIDPRMGERTRSMVEAPEQPAVESMVTALINDVTAAGRPFALVLDDYHAITEMAVHEAVETLLEHMPPRMHLVITTRVDPPLALSRLRGRHQVTEIRQRDLRFTVQEAAAFMQRSMGLHLTSDDIASLESRTEGWIAGLQLAALSLQGRDKQESARFIERFSGRHHMVLDYLTDEVLARQPEPLQWFLLRTSVLERLCGPLCDALLEPGEVTGPPGRQILQQLAGANLFLAPLDVEREWYRYHPLFADLLRARLREARPDAIPGLHCRAVAWYESQGLTADAMHHALAAPDYYLAADVLERTTARPRTWSRFDVATLQKWLTALPDEVTSGRPWLRLFTARVLYSAGHGDAAGRMMDGLESWLSEHPSADDAERLQGMMAADRAGYAVVTGEIGPAMAYARRALDEAPADDLGVRLRAVSTLGLAYQRVGDVEGAQRAFEEAIRLADAADVAFAAVPFLCNLAEVHIIQGRLHDAFRTCQRAFEAGTVDGSRIAPAGFAGLEMARVLYQWNDLEGAEHHLLDGIESLRRGGIGEGYGNLHALLALVKQGQGDERGAREAAQHAVNAADRSGIERLSAQAAAHQAWVWLAQGRIRQAAGWADGYRQSGETEYLREFEELTLARVLLAQGMPERALAEVEPGLALAKECGRVGSAVDFQVVKALALAASGADRDALEALAHTLEAAEGEGYVRIFLDLGPPMEALLRRAASLGMAPGYVGRLLAAFGASPGRGGAPPAQPLLEPLTDRELEVLHLLAQGLTNAEIVQRLVISLPTVKTHNRNLYGKLGVRGRREAVARARALGILPPA